MIIEIFGIQSINKVVNEDTEHFANVITLKFEIQDRDHDSLISVIVEHIGFSESEKKNFIMSSKTGFQISDADLSFLKHPLNPQTVHLCVELAQTAIAHNRVFALLNSKEEQSISITSYTNTQELTEIVKHSLSATLN